MLFAFLFLLLQDTGETIDTALKRFVDVYAAIKENAAEKVDEAQAMYGGALPGMLRRLDPHSVFFDPGNFEQHMPSIVEWFQAHPPGHAGA